MSAPLSYKLTFLFRHDAYICICVLLMLTSIASCHTVCHFILNYHPTCGLGYKVQSQQAEEAPVAAENSPASDSHVYFLRVILSLAACVQQARPLLSGNVCYTNPTAIPQRD